MIDTCIDFTKDFLISDDASLNNKFINSIFNQIRLMAMNMFVWKNLPDNIEPYMIENWLFDLSALHTIRDMDTSSSGAILTVCWNSTIAPPQSQ